MRYAWLSSWIVLEFWTIDIAIVEDTHCKVVYRSLEGTVISTER